MVSITIPNNYGCVNYLYLRSLYILLTTPSAVIAVALGAIPVLGFIHGGITTSLRKKAKVPYPHSYATVEQCKENVSPSLPPSLPH
jgi:glutathione S-transferase